MEAIEDCCVLAAVGQQMASRKGVSATLFGALAKANINIRCGRGVAGAARGGAAVSIVHLKAWVFVPPKVPQWGRCTA